MFARTQRIAEEFGYRLLDVTKTFRIGEESGDKYLASIANKPGTFLYQESKISIADKDPSWITLMGSDRWIDIDPKMSDARIRKLFNGDENEECCICLNELYKEDQYGELDCDICAAKICASCSVELSENGEKTHMKDMIYWSTFPCPSCRARLQKIVTMKPK